MWTPVAMSRWPLKELSESTLCQAKYQEGNPFSREGVKGSVATPSQSI
jgi:hypothetical protein